MRYTNVQHVSAYGSGTYAVAAFRSRQQSIRLDSELKKRGIASAIISTPREISLGCGISVKITPQDAGRAAELARSLHSDAFMGVYIVYQEGGKEVVERLAR